MEWTHQEMRDENGVGVDLIQHEDIIMPATYKNMEPEKRLKLIRERKYKKGDTLICSYPKTGTHWLSNLVYFLTTPGPVDSMTTIPPTLMDMIPMEKWEVVEKNHILNSHFQINRLPKEHIEQGGKVIIITRDPRDAMVSLKYHFQNHDLLNRANISWTFFFDRWLGGNLPFGSYFDYYNSWERAINDNKNMDTLIVHFENLKTDGFKELKRIQEFLQVENTDDRLQQILERCSIKKLRTDIDSGKLDAALKDKDGKSFIYRKGDVGDWKNHFTVAQSERFDQVVEEKFKGSIFKL